MKASTFSRVGYGKNPDEAYNDAYNDAQLAYGQQDGYPGDLIVKDGFQVARTPENVELNAWLDALIEGRLPQTLQMHFEEFERQLDIYDNKQGPALCFEAVDKIPIGNRKKYIFVGWAPE